MPHYRNFDGSHFDYYKPGDFYLVRTDDATFVIQKKVTPPNKTLTPAVKPSAGSVKSGWALGMKDTSQESLNFIGFLQEAAQAGADQALIAYQADQAVAGVTLDDDANATFIAAYFQAFVEAINAVPAAIVDCSTADEAEPVVKQVFNDTFSNSSAWDSVG